nr:DUF655 domain-containing protein [Sporanaerobium hydrogeniformans]
MVAYQTAYLKQYYKVEFMAALMTSVMDVSTKITGYMETCRRMEIAVLSPDINEGYAYFDAKDNQIIYGLAALKNVGKNVIDHIVEERERGGKFKSLTDFYNRMDTKDTNKRSIESLILAGAFDKLGGRRSQYLAVYQQISSGINLSRKNNIAGQMDLFALGRENEEIVQDYDHLPDIPEFEMKDMLAYEKDVLGIYLSGHPLDKVRGQLERYISHTGSDFILKEEEDENVQDGQRVIVGGILVEKRVIYTKNNKKMAFVTLEDLTGTMEIIIFPTLYDQFASFPEDSVYMVKGRISIKEETAAVILADELTTLEILMTPQCEEGLILHLDKNQRTQAMREKLLHIFEKHKGNAKIIVQNKEDGTQKIFPKRYNVALTDELIQEVSQLVGEKCMVVHKLS